MTAALRTTIRNKTRGTVLHERPYWARNILQLGTGFMFRRPRGECLILVRMPSRRDVITMWFVFGPLDIVALDGTGKVVALREGLRPWRSWDVGMKASAVVELPPGTILRTRTAIGDLIALPQPHAASMWRWHHYALFLLTQTVTAAFLAFIVLALLFVGGFL